MRNYTLRTVKGSSLFSLLIIALWVLPVGTSCKFENAPPPTPKRQQVADIKKVLAAQTWICGICGRENSQHEAICCQCNAVKQQADQKQLQEDKKADKQDNKLGEEEALNQADPNKDQCPVCLEWFTKEQQTTCRYWVCNHFVCELCYKNIRSAKKLHDYCPTCRCQVLRSDQGEAESACH